ncbi:hypothetical protein [Gemmatimonas sp.]
MAILTAMKQGWLITIAWLLGGCRASDADVGADHGRETFSATADAPLRLSSSPLGMILLPDSAGWQAGTVGGAVRLQVRPAEPSAANDRLCGVLVSGSTWPVSLPWGWPIDSTAPRLAQRRLNTAAVQGVRFVIPGAQAKYIFEGVTTNGRHRVSLHWPVTSRPGVVVPIGSPDSLVEAALEPSPADLDSLLAALESVSPTIGTLPPSAVKAAVDNERAVPDVRPIPVYRAELTAACPRATLAMRAVARADFTVKMPMGPGEAVIADATVTDGIVRLGFDEAGTRYEQTGREPVPHAEIAATESTVVTLRVRVQVVPKVQANQQVVHLALQKIRADTARP